MQSKAVFFVLVAVGALLIAGCGDDQAALPPGSVSVNWLVGTSGCSGLSVDTVAVLIEGGELSGTNVRTYPCSAGEATLSGLAPGVYDLTLRGQDQQGVDRFEGEARNVDVRSGGITSVPTVRLTALPAVIDVTWYFDNGRMCAHNEIETVGITLFQDEYEVLTGEAPCQDAAMTIDQVPANTYVIDLVARDASGNIQFNGQESLVVERGDQTAIEVRLLPLRTGVDGE